MLASLASLELALNRLCQALAELNTPLIKGVDVPDGALDKGEMLVVDNEGTKSARGDGALDEDAGCWSVAQKGLVLEELLFDALGAELFLALADHQRFGLGEKVARQHDLVLVVGDGVVGLGRQDKVGRDELGALVE